MSVKCRHCQQSITSLKLREANVITTGKYHVPYSSRWFARIAASITTQKSRLWNLSLVRKNNDYTRRSQKAYP